jgi:eukaryotic-like serine/threonine-protein kinase
MPKILGRYHIISELGRGGMGVVYKAVDPKLERFIAIKCLSDELSTDEITVTRFLREARNVAALNHPHIAQIYLADEDDGKPYFVMEYVDGESLADKLERDRRLMPEQARRIVAECAQALKAAHEENIVHRDIKPGNIMIDRRGRSVLTDFGIASIVHPDNQPSSSKYIMGTPGYLPPEVMTGSPADHRGDIFALGAVYYEMLAGKRLVPGSGIEDTARTLLAADFPELGELDDQLDDKTFGVLGRMLAPDPDKRYQDYDSLINDLMTEPLVVIPAASPAHDEPTQVTPAPVSAASASASKPAEAPATKVVDPTVAAPPPTQSSPPPANRHRARNFGLLGALVLSLVLVGVGLARLAPEQWDQITGLFGSEEEPAAVASDESIDAMEPVPLLVEATGLTATGDQSDADEPADRSVVHDRESEMVEADPISASAARLIGSTDSADAAAPIASTDSEMVGSAELVEHDEAVSLSDQSEVQPVPEVPEPAPEQSPLVVASIPAADVSARPAEPATASAMPQPVPEPAPVAPSPVGVLVIGQGDPIFVDPMVREVEQSLRSEGREIIERGFVRGLSSLVSDSDIDLAGLSEVAVAAGAGYAVIVSAMPAGQRQLQYYGRSDTAFIVQTETISYDLVDRRRLSASELAQVEYTALNATAQARNAIAPQLARINQSLPSRDR